MQKKKKINLPVVMGSIIIIFFVVIALLAPYIAPYDPAATIFSANYCMELASRWESVFLLHLLLPFWERFWRCFPGGMEDMWTKLLLL